MLALITVALIGLGVGYSVSRNASEAERREAQLDRRSTEAPIGKGGLWKGAATKARTGDSRAPILASEHPESLEFFNQICVTSEDLRRVEEMEKRRAQGEYILRNERPTTRKFLDYDFSQIVAQAAADRAPEYDQLFAEMGVTPEVAEQLKTHLAKIHRASLEATVAIQQILQARHDYDERLRSTVSEENYHRYRQVEEAKPARREYQKFQRFVGDQNFLIDQEREQALVGLIQAAEAYTSRSLYGPFDGLPQPIIGTENVVRAEEQKIAEITHRSSQLLEMSSQAGLPAEYNALLERYYAEKMQQRKSSLEELKTQMASHAAGPNP